MVRIFTQLGMRLSVHLIKITNAKGKSFWKEECPKNLIEMKKNTISLLNWRLNEASHNLQSDLHES